MSDLVKLDSLDSAIAAETLREIRDSQLRTEQLVKEFIEGISQNPMFRMMLQGKGI